MRRDTRANLIFLAVIFCMMAGPVTLTIYRRWGKPGRLIEPPPVRDRLAFIDRTAGVASRHLSRVVPPLLGGYTAQLTQQVVKMQRGLKPLVTDEHFVPVMSDGLTMQLIGEGAYAGKYRWAVIGWSGKLAPLPSLYRFEATRGGQPLAATLESYDSPLMPIEIRKELQGYGYILPPDGLIWMIVAVDGEAAIESLTMHYNGLGTRVDETLVRDDPAGRSPSSSPATQPGGPR